MNPHVACGLAQELRIVAELADAGVAVEAEQAAHAPGRVVVVDVEALTLRRRRAAQRAPATLAGQPLVVLLGA